MNRRTAAALSALSLGAVVLTGCGGVGSPVNPSGARGMVVEKETQLDSNGGREYKLTLTTDRKAIRRKASRHGSKEKEITVSEKVWKQCDLKEMYQSCK